MIPKLSLNEVIKKQSIPSSTDLMADKRALPRSFQLAAPWQKIHSAKEIQTKKNAHMYTSELRTGMNASPLTT